MKNQSAFAAVVSIFFFWGFMAASNGIFIPFCKQYFSLSQFQSQLIDFTFYGGYFIGSLLLFLYTLVSQKDLVQQLGYAQSFAAGLVLSAIGAALMIPSLHSGHYGFILASFFIIALGFSLQQTVANPFVILLGDERTGAHRLNLAGGINSLGTTIGPLIVAYFLFGSAFNVSTNVSLTNVDTLYAILAVLFISLAILLSRVKIEQRNTENTNTGISFDALRYPQVRFGMLAIFIYVGVEVTLQSNLGALLKTQEYGAYDSALIAPFISLYWGSLMIGRWAAASEAITPNANIRKALLIILPLLAYLLVYGVNWLKAQQDDVSYIHSTFAPYFVFVLLMASVAYFTISNAAQMLLAFSLAAVMCTVGAMLTSGNISLMLILSGGLWCSVMWPCIFAIAIHNLGKYTSQASAFLIMMILGGAIIPPIQGFIADFANIKTSYIVAPFCFAYLAWYAWKFRKQHNTV